MKTLITTAGHEREWDERFIVSPNGSRIDPRSRQAAHAIAGWAGRALFVFASHENRNLSARAQRLPRRERASLEAADNAVRYAICSYCATIFALAADYYDAFGLRPADGIAWGAPVGLDDLETGGGQSSIRFETTDDWRAFALVMHDWADEAKRSASSVASPERRVPATRADHDGMGLPVIVVAGAPWAANVALTAVAYVGVAWLISRAVIATVMALSAVAGVNLSSLRSASRAADNLVKCVERAESEEEIQLCMLRYEGVMEALPAAVPRPWRTLAVAGAVAASAVAISRWSRK